MGDEIKLNGLNNELPPPPPINKLENSITNKCQLNTRAPFNTDNDLGGPVKFGYEFLFFKFLFHTLPNDNITLLQC